NRPVPTKVAPTSQSIQTYKASSPTINEQPSWKSFHISARVLLPLRLFLGITFLYAGIQKVTDPQFFNPKATGFIGNQILAFAHGSPIHNILLHVALPHALFFGAVIAFGEMAIGIGTLLGFLFRPAAFFGMLLSLLFFLSASWHVYPYFYGADIVFFFAWTPLLLAGPLGSGLPSIDAVMVRRILMDMSPKLRGTIAPVFNFFLGVGDVVDKENMPLEEMPTQAVNRINGQGAQYNSKVSGYPQAVPQHIMSGQGRQGNVYGNPQQQRQVNYKGRNAAIRRSQENRRNFLWGLAVGGLGMLGITVAGRAVLSHSFGGDDSTSTVTQNPSSVSGTQSTPATGTTTTANGATEIAKVSAVQPNSAVTFTIPSNGDPGVLIRLSNGKFVAFDATCTHAGCPVQYDPSSQHLLCPCHGAEFDPSHAASVVQGPTNTPLTSVPINVNNSTGAITLQ
ncbi:MAG TPA: TQO small subunit DoxD, partial [Ktedonobacteraceae bacterium]|nr:TQO small subunit DoxD [Ktedonobacteraceae bacterium]